MKLSNLLAHITTTQGSSDGGRTWHPVRPQTAENTFLRYRIAAAWRVLRGQSDAIEWGVAERLTNQQDNNR